jgi:hypothetical protein
MAAKKKPSAAHAVSNTNSPAKSVPTPAPAAVAPAAPAATKPVAAAPATVAPAAVVKQPAPAPVVRDRSTVVALIAKLRHHDADLARDAAITLGTLPPDAEAVDALCTVIKNTDRFFHPVVRAAAAATLGTLGDRRAVDALLVATHDPMAEASEEAIKALGLLGDPRAAATLEQIIRNDSGFFLDPVRRTAEAALRRLPR